jgi:hypothetical protein
LIISSRTGSCFVASVAAIALAQAQSSDWVRSMADSPIVKNSPLSKRMAKSLEQRPSPVQTSRSQTGSVGTGTVAPGPTGLTHVPRRPPTPEELARQAFLESEGDRASALEASGNYVGARTILEDLLTTKVGGSGCLLGLLDLEIAHSDYTRAFKTVAPFVENSADYRLWVRASLAAASIGQVYPGQREFLLKLLEGPEHDPNNDAYKAIAFPGDTPEVIAVLSHIAYAELAGEDFTTGAQHWLIALQYDPGNPALSMGLSYCYYRLHRYKDAIDAAEAGLPRSGSSGRLNSTLKSNMTSARWSLTKYGEGNGPPDERQTSSTPSTIHP